MPTAVRSRRIHVLVALLLVGNVVGPAVRSVAEPTSPNGRCPATAATKLNWGSPNRSEEFNDPSLAGWYLYSGPGNGGNGVRTPAAVSVANGVMTITGDAAGNTEGMGWNSGQLYGRWEVCAQSSPASPNYHSVLLLWPDSERWPADGEIDFMEIFDPTRQNVTGSVLHVWPENGPDRNDHASLAIDATGWHSWAVEWNADHIIGYADGNEWFRTTTHIPRGAMHLCIQLDHFGGDVSEGGQLMVDWARQYRA